METKRKTGVTTKTLGALKENVNKIEDSKLLTKEEVIQLKGLIEKVKTNWITKNL